MPYYSQSGQDSYLDTYVFQGFRRGVFVEIGAWDGVDLSNTVFFERERAWTGLVVEPLPDRYATLITQRKCKTENVAISDVEGETDFLALSGPTSMLSGIVSNYHPRHVERIDKEAEELNATKTLLRVPTRRLDSLFRKHSLSRIHYLSVDVEGSEFQVLQSIDFNAVYIDVIGFENNYPDKTVEIVSYLKARGYTELHSSGGDLFMIRTNSSFAPKKFTHLRR
jgi:FkbM family methyltransferase